MTLKLLCRSEEVFFITIYQVNGAEGVSTFGITAVYAVSGKVDDQVHNLRALQKRKKILNQFSF